MLTTEIVFIDTVILYKNQHNKHQDDTTWSTQPRLQTQKAINITHHHNPIDESCTSRSSIVRTICFPEMESVPEVKYRVYQDSSCRRWKKKRVSVRVNALIIIVVAVLVESSKRSLSHDR